ncbi:hypothetical protein FACS1894166_08370 [Bacilli bacterium]|nr:hypothetical protein FACS1894166_08370 [Bacilli bacterium]
MQSILHTNTLNYHLQIRLYQNNKTPLTDIQNKWTIKPESYLKVKAKINKYLQLQIHKPVRAIINKRLSLEQQHNNEVYQTYNRYAQDILHLCNQGENATNKKITIKLTNIYFNQNKYISN